jgi:hypothetical protein
MSAEVAANFEPPRNLQKQREKEKEKKKRGAPRNVDPDAVPFLWGKGNPGSGLFSPKPS